MIPKKIQPFFKTTFQKNGDNRVVEGILTCCNSYDFEVFVVGEIKYSIFSRKICLIPQNDEMVLKVRCKKCGRVISVFDSRCDGYEQCGNNHPKPVQNKAIACMKCHDGCFSVNVKYEYSDIQELEELEITEIDNAFTWIWITLKCNKCGAVYKNFIDYETA